MRRLLILLAAPALLAACTSASLHESHRAAQTAHAQAAQDWIAAAPQGAALEPWMAAERSRIAAEQNAARQRFEQAEKACWKRFAVNDCVSRARQQRRQTQDRLRQQELALNALERRLAAQPDDPAASQPPASRQP